MSEAVILVSPGAVDGYPPVQYQARILADAGFTVELVTQPLATAKAVKFQYPGVNVTALKPIPRGLHKFAHRLSLLRLMLQFIIAVTLIRLHAKHVRAEVAFEPDGIFISDYALLRPRRRIAHLHETQQRLGKSHIETRLRCALPRYDLVVVADHDRAILLCEQMGTDTLPWVTPNYPLKEIAVAGTMNPGPGFEVIYAGTLAPMQMLDLVIRSVPLWPKEAHLTLIGDDTKPEAVKLKALAGSLGLSDRVRFEGWLDLDKVIDRYRRAHLAISLLSPDLNDILRNVGASNNRYQFMQAGLAQIGDRIPALVEIIEGGDIGRCVPEYSEQAVADLIDYYWRHPEERLAAGRKAEQLHLDRYNYQAAFEPTLRWISEGQGA